MEENDRSVYFSIQSRSCYPHVQTNPCRNPSGLFCRDVSFDVDFFDANGLAIHDVYEKGYHFLLKHKQRTLVVRSQRCKTNLCASTCHAVWTKFRSRTRSMHEQTDLIDLWTRHYHWSQFSFTTSSNQYSREQSLPKYSVDVKFIYVSSGREGFRIGRRSGAGFLFQAN